MHDKANRIGALVMHLAAAEAVLSGFTFENRDFNAEEEKMGRSFRFGSKAVEMISRA
jgi:hypothetical protein